MNVINNSIENDVSFIEEFINLRKNDLKHVVHKI